MCGGGKPTRTAALCGVVVLWAVMLLYLFTYGNVPYGQAHGFAQNDSFSRSRNLGTLISISNNYAGRSLLLSL